MLKKLLLTAVAALSLITLIACDDSSAKKAEDANDHIAILNSIDAELKTNGVYVITYQRFGLPSNLTNTELARVKELLTTFIYRGNKVLSLTADENIIFSDGLKLQIAIENANRLLSSTQSYETYETKLARLKQEDERRKLEEEKRKEEEQAKTAKRNADYRASDASERVRSVVRDLGLRGFYFQRNDAKEVNAFRIEKMNKDELIALERDLVVLQTRSKVGLDIWSISNRYSHNNPGYEIYTKESAEYLVMVRARLETLTGSQMVAPTIPNPNQIGTVEAIKP